MYTDRKRFILSNWLIWLCGVDKSRFWRGGQQSGYSRKSCSSSPKAEFPLAWGGPSSSVFRPSVDWKGLSYHGEK